MHSIAICILDLIVNLCSRTRSGRAGDERRRDEAGQGKERKRSKNKESRGAMESMCHENIRETFRILGGEWNHLEGTCGTGGSSRGEK